jgi:hypothetical protein
LIIIIRKNQTYELTSHFKFNFIYFGKKKKKDYLYSSTELYEAGHL